MKLFRSTRSKICFHLEITEVELFHCDNVNNNEHDSRVLYTFAPDKSFGQLLNISPKNCTFSKTFGSEF